MIVDLSEAAPFNPISLDKVGQPQEATKTAKPAVAERAAVRELGQGGLLPLGGKACPARTGHSSRSPSRCWSYLKLGARYYNPTTGRFTQPDPAALIGGYAYAGDNPTNLSDPTGLVSIGGIIGAVVGGAVGYAAAGLLCSTGVGCLIVAGIAVGALGGEVGGGVGAAADGTDVKQGIMDGEVYGGIGGGFGALP